jgi:proteasome accessory factor C
MKSDPSERLRRLLLIVPYAAKNPGVSVDVLARKLGVERAELLEDLETLLLVGRPPFSPDDFIDIYVENDRVFVAFDQHFSRPPRLTAPEAAALWASAQLMKPAAQTALAAAQRKLLSAVPEGSRDVFARLAERVGSEAAPMADLLEPLAAAVRSRHEVELEYLAAGRSTGERRVVRPYAVYLRLGNWYLDGYCCTRGGERRFRVDRIRSLEVTDRVFEPAVPGQGSEPARARASARVRFSSRAAPFARERYGEAAKDLPDGSVEVSIPGASGDWLVPHLLSYGGEAEVIEPVALREAVAEAARKIIQAHQG